MNVGPYNRCLSLSALYQGLLYPPILADFAAVLTAKSISGVESPLSDSRSDYKATGRFTFHKRNLYYSFYSSARPRGVQFTDLRGNILEEQVGEPELRHCSWF